MVVNKIHISALTKIKRRQYNHTKVTFCPFLNELVYFNNKGFYHATHDGRGKIRNESDARMRLYLLACIVSVIKKSTISPNKPRMILKNDPNNKTGRDIIFYELCYRFNSKKIVSVILRKQGNGHLHYFSVKYTAKNKIDPDGI